MLKSFDKDKNGSIELSEMGTEKLNDKIMYRLFKALDKLQGNNDGVLTEDEWNKALVSEGKTGGLVRTRLGGRGDVTATHVGWRHSKGLPYVTAPVLYENILYSVRDGGILSAFNPETGQVLREERLKDALGPYYASPVAGDGKIYFISQEGKVTVLKPGADWSVLSTGELDAPVIATPAIAGSRIYVRTETTLYCFGLPRG